MISALDEGDGLIYSMGKATVTRWTRGWVGPGFSRRGGKQKNLYPSTELDPVHRHPARTLALLMFLHGMEIKQLKRYVIPYPTAFPYGNGMVLHFYQQQESSTTKTVHKVINKRLKTYV